MKKTVPQFLDKGGDGSSLLMENFHNLDAMKLLLERGANPDGIFFQLWWETLLMHCVKSGLYDQMELLFQHGASPHVRDVMNRTAIHYVGTEGALKLLLAHGADINSVDIMGRTVLDTHIEKGYVGIDFVKYGARITYTKDLKNVPHIFHAWVRRKWALVKCYVRLMSLYKRAVITANHPERKFARGEFECDDE